jgi:ABC-type Fe3+-hydroxamate transport system substrate-binding protein
MRKKSLSIGLVFTFVTVMTVVGSLSTQAEANRTTVPPLVPIGSVVTGSFPTDPTKLASDNGIFIDDLVSLGYHLACYTSAQPLYGRVAALISSAQKLSFVTATGFDAEQLAACAPDGIVTGYLPRYGNAGGSLDESVAPTAFIGQPNPALNPSGTAVAATTWKTWFFNMAAFLGGQGQQRAATVIANTDRQSAALRGLVQGKSAAFLEARSASTFALPGDQITFAQLYVRDLGMKNFHLDPSQYTASGNPCNPATFLGVCNSATVSDELLPELNGADLVIVDNDGIGTDTSALTTNPLFQAIPAIKAGRFVDGGSWSNLGPNGASFEYTAIAVAAGIKQYHTTVTGGVGAQADFALDPASNRACWAIDPTPGKADPEAAITLSTTPKPGMTITLSSKPRYFDPEAKSDPQGGNSWETSPQTYETDGCITLSKAFTKAWTSSGGTNIHLTIGGASAHLTHGVPSIEYVSS